MTSPKGSQRRSISEEEHQHPKDAVTLSAVSNYDCSCGFKGKPQQDNGKGSSPEKKIFQHAPPPFSHKTSEKE